MIQKTSKSVILTALPPKVLFIRATATLIFMYEYFYAQNSTVITHLEIFLKK